jgi:hypothetical protein
MATTYLAAGTDRAVFYKATYNDTTKAVTVQMTSMEAQRNGSGNLGCFTMYATGTMGGSVRVGKTADAYGTTGHATTLAVQDGTTGGNWDDCEATDTKDFANGSGNGTSVEGFAMNYSCNDLKLASGSGKPFEGNTVDFDITLTEVDAMFGIN